LLCSVDIYIDGLIFGATHKSL